MCIAAVDSPAPFPLIKADAARLTVIEVKAPVVSVVQLVVVVQQYIKYIHP